MTKRAAKRVGTILLSAALLFEIPTRSVTAEPRVDTRTVNLDYWVHGFTQLIEELSLGDPVSLADVDQVLIEPIAVERFGEGGRYRLSLSFDFMDGDEVVFRGSEPFGGNFSAWTDVRRVPIAVSPDDRQVNSVRFVHGQNSEGATSLSTHVRGQLGDGAVRLHFVSGFFGPDGPNLARAVSPAPEVRVDGSGVSAWWVTPFAEPVPADNLRLVFTTGEPWGDWRFPGGGTTEAELLFAYPPEPGDVLPMDGMFSPADGNVLPRWVSAEHSLLIDQETQEEIDGREIVGFRWRLRREGDGWMELTSVWPQVRFAYHVEPESLRFRRGDCNDDGTIDLSDGVYTLNWLFLGGDAPSCVAVTDTNGDGVLNVADPTFLFNFLFLGGPAPAPPYPDCGTSELPADGTLGCLDFGHCP